MSNPTTNNNHSIAIIISNLTRAIQQAIESILFTHTRENSTNKIPNDIQNKITNKNRLRREWKRTYDPSIERLLNPKIIFI